MHLMSNSNYSRSVTPKGSWRKRQAGFTLIEVLVSVLILSIGLVGVAGLQAVSLQNNQSAFMRSQASALAYDLADRMRSNVLSVYGSLYDPGTAAAVSGCRSPTGCTPQDLARNDLAEWNAAVASYLPMGQGFVCVDSTPNDGASAGDPQCDGLGTQLSVKVWWDDNRDGLINMTATNPERLAIVIEL
jgi:type IV pilus assembly protein PilV